MFSESLMEDRIICRGRSLRNSRGKALIQQGRKEGIHRVYGSGVACKRLRDENGHGCTGECGGYPC